MDNKKDMDRVMAFQANPSLPEEALEKVSGGRANGLTTKLSVDHGRNYDVSLDGEYATVNQGGQ